MISCVLPISNNEMYHPFCLSSLQISARRCPEEVEIIKIYNKIGVRRAKNFGALLAEGEILVFVDADCMVSPDFFSEIHERMRDSSYLGGGIKKVRATNPTLGSTIFMGLVAGLCKVCSISIGILCVRTPAFFAVGGFPEAKYNDLRIAFRLRKWAKKEKMKFSSLKESWLLWSTRKFDRYGSWHWLRGYQVG